MGSESEFGAAVTRVPDAHRTVLGRAREPSGGSVEMNRFPCETSDPFGMSLEYTTSRFTSDRVPDAHASVHTTGGEQPFTSIPFDTEKPSGMSHQMVLGCFGRKVPQSTCIVSRPGS